MIACTRMASVQTQNMFFQLQWVGSEMVYLELLDATENATSCDTREHVTFYAFILLLSLHMQCSRGEYRFNG